MKLATLKSDSRDGTLIVVSKDLKTAVKATSIAKTLQGALDNWKETAPKLQALYDSLVEGKEEGSFEVNMKNLHSPLPRAYQWLDGSAFIRHIELARKARGAELPPGLKTTPLMYQGGSDFFLPPHGNIPNYPEEFGADFEAEIGVILDDVPQGTKAIEANKYINLIVLINDISLRGLIPNELKMGFGFLQSKPPCAFSPVALTPDELGEHWKEGRVHLPLISEFQGKEFGRPNGNEMHFSFFDLIEHASKTRPLTAGTILGSGTVANTSPVVGHSCLTEKRMVEKIETGEMKTPFMKSGDQVRIWMDTNEGEALFGEINQVVD